MQFKIEQIDPKVYKGNLIFLYGNEVADRSLPLGKKELDCLKRRRRTEGDSVVVFDRLPYRLYVVNFDSECQAGVCHERLRRRADRVVSMLKSDGQHEAAVVGEGVIPEEVVAYVEGMFLSG